MNFNLNFVQFYLASKQLNYYYYYYYYPVSNSENLSAILVVVSISTCPMKDTNPNCVICLMILYRKLINYLYTPETKFFYIVATYSQKSHGT